MQHARAEELVQAQRHEVSQRHKEGAQFEMENLKAAREMQKKMGKALLRNMAEAREKNEKAQKEASLHDSIAEEQKTTLKPKKSVSFADLPPEGKGESKDRAKLREKEVQLDWGDVAPAKLRSANRTTLMTKAQMNQHPMKLDVVERLPTVRSEPEESIIQVQDSDDESVPSSPISVDSNQSDVIQSDRNIGSLEVADPDSGEDDSEDGLLSDDDEFDLDTARHHREIALAYYDKRDVTGENAAAALTFHTKNEEENEWNQPVCVTDFALLCERPPYYCLIGSASGCHTIIFATRVSFQGRSYCFSIQCTLSIYFHIYYWNIYSLSFRLTNFATRHPDWPPRKRQACRGRRR
jgi:hypothetical protein